MTTPVTDSQQLQEYLRRVKFSGEPRPDLDTLRRLHRGHLAAIPYENLDVQLGRPVGFDRAAIFDKLVRSRRGGWCFEMNGLLGWALEQIGFRVTRVAGAVTRDVRGDSSIGNHLALVVELDRLYLADVGFGDGLVEPAPIVAGSVRQDFFDYRFEQVGAWWRFHNHPYGGAPTFDFQLSAPVADVLERQSDWLQTSPESGFVQNSVCQRFHDNRLSILRGKVLKLVDEHGVTQRIVEDLADYRHVLDNEFDIDLPEIDRLWERVNVRHAAWLASSGTVPAGGAVPTLPLQRPQK
jgi:N-hydroxyarylamine O-acetyltransferase